MAFAVRALCLLASGTVASGAVSSAQNASGADVGRAQPHARRAAFELVYREARWMKGGDGARCASGWSDVEHSQGEHACNSLVRVVQTYRIRSILDVPVGDGCFSR